MKYATYTALLIPLYGGVAALADGVVYQKKITKCAQNKISLKQKVGAKNDTTRYKTIQKDTKSDDTFL